MYVFNSNLSIFVQAGSARERCYNERVKESLYVTHVA